MGIQVVNRTGMNGSSLSTYDTGTTWKRDSRENLVIYDGTKKIAEHASGTWELVRRTVDVSEKKTKKVAKKKATSRPRTHPSYGQEKY